MFADATRTEWNCGRRNFLVCAATGIPLLVLGAFAASILFGMSFVDSLIISASGIIGVAFTAVLILWLRDRSTAGAVLLDCGNPPAKHWYGLATAGFLLPALVLILTGPNEMSEILIVINGLIVSGFLVGHTFSRLQVRERGIWCYGSLLRWSSITSCEWDQESDATLLIRYKTWFPWYREMVLPVALEHKPALSELLAAHRSAVGMSPP